MTERRPQPGELYMHFKNKLYQVLTIARHSETGEELVIYQALYGDYGVYARPLAMFAGEVDQEKYPQVTQKYRFEKIDRSKLEPASSHVGTQESGKNDVPQSTAAILQENSERPAPETAQSEQVPVENGTADARLLRFLDADTYKEKYKVLSEMEPEITDRLINDFAVIVDVVIPEGELSFRYDQLKQALATLARYETSRLR